MFYILESKEQLDWLENQTDSPIYVDVISTNFYYHSKLTSTIGVYVKVLNDKEGYFIPVSHNDGLNVDKDRIYAILSKFKTLYTLNKKTLLYHFNLQRAIDISLVYSMSNYKRLEYSTANTSIDWYYRTHNEKPDLNRIIPIVKLYERCENIFNQIEQHLALPIPDGFDFYNNITTNVFFLLEQNGVGIVYADLMNCLNP